MTRSFTDDPQFYLTVPQNCPYLDGQFERKIFTHLVGEDAVHLNNILSKGGFRRSQTIAYRPACEGCKACKSARVVVPLYDFSRNQRRMLKRNDDLISIVRTNDATSEQYDLFQTYLLARHGDGGMADMNMGDYKAMVEESHVETEVIEYRLRDPDSGITGTSSGPLVAVALTDRLDGGLSMVYSFFDPTMADRSLGTFIILDHIRRAMEESLFYVYLGYWVEGSEKMAYKTRFRPLEILEEDGWVYHE